MKIDADVSARSEKGIKSFLEKHDAGWKLVLNERHGRESAVVSSDDMNERRLSGADGKIRMEWTGHPDFGPDFTVTAVWREVSQGHYGASFEYRNYQGKFFVDEIIFPLLRAPFFPDSRFLESANNMGHFLDVAEGEIEPEKITRRRCRSMQFSAILNKREKNFYIEQRDPAWNMKSIELCFSQKTAVMLLGPVFFAGSGDVPGTAGSIPYESCACEFEGSWFDAAQIYKKWALKQEWAVKRSGRANPLRKIGMWVWNRGRIDDVVPPVEQLQKDLPGVPVALNWYWWHHNPYDTNYPFYWPPRDDANAFRDAVKCLTDQGIYVQAYMNGVLWDSDDPEWADGGEDCIIIRRNGIRESWIYNVYTKHHLASMCGEAPAFHDLICDQARHLRESGMSGQYLDSVGSSSMNDCCYNPKHNHPKGGGTYKREGFRRLIRRLIEAGPDRPITMEWANEAYMDLIAGATICGAVSHEHISGKGEPVPLFTAVYHGSLALYGSYAEPDGIPPWDPLWPPEDRWKQEKDWNALYPDQFFIDLARSIVWGAQPMVCNLKPGIRENPKFRAQYKFILDTADFYMRNREFLFDGEMLSPDGFSCAEKEVLFRLRIIFTREKDCKTIRRRMPVILHSVWRAPDGKKALVLANYTADEQAWRFQGMSGVLPSHSYKKIALD